MEKTKSMSKIKELEDKLAKLQQEKSDEHEETDVLKLKRALLIFKKKYQRALQDLSKAEPSKDIGVLEQKLNDAANEQKALIEQQQTLKKILKDDRARLKKLQEKYNYTIKRLNVYEAAILEKSNNQTASTDVLEISKSLEKDKKNKEQIEELKRKIEEKERQIKELQNYKSKDSQLQVNKKELEESKQHAGQLQRAVDHVREKLEETKLDAKQLQNDYQEAMEKIELLNLEIAKNDESEKSVNASCDSLTIENEKLSEQLKEINEKLGTKQKTISSYTDTIEKKENEISLLQKRENKLEQELKQMKETLVRGLKEAKELKIYYQNLGYEKTEAIQKNTR